ncbi:MAG: hypothetical protein MJK12_05025 [Colwellia sp.]|nr:hypothetical protein [Colwellia sp.]
MKWTIFIIIILSFGSAAIMTMKPTSQDKTKQLAEHPKTFNQQHEVIILVDVKVGKNGKALEVKLSQPERYTSFNTFALLDAKNRQYPQKEAQGKFIEYWLNNVKIQQLISPMGTQIKPLTMPEAKKN